MGVNKEIALQIIDSFPYSVCLYRLSSGKIEFLNQQAKKTFLIDELEINENQSALEKIFKNEELDKLKLIWKKSLQPGSDIPNKVLCWLMDKTESYNLYELAIGKMGEDPALNDYILISAVEKDLSFNVQDEFINLAAHDLLSPVRKLSTFTGRLKEKFPELAAGNVYMDRIENTLGNIRSLIDSLTEYSQLNPVNNPTEDVDLNKIVGGVLIEMESFLIGKNVKLMCGNLPVVRADQNQSKILFRQLIDNAVRFATPDAETIIRIGSESYSEKDETGKEIAFYKISIRDNGIGFPENKKDEIFKPFVRLHGKSDKGGDGMGLAICRKITMNLGWQLYGESDESLGTCFTLILPNTKIQDV